MAVASIIAYNITLVFHNAELLKRK